MEPITREEYYLAKIAGTYEGNTPEPVTIEEYYLATMAGDYSGNTPQPVTRLQYYMAKVAGVWGGSIPAPVTRLEYYWAAIASGEGKVFPPVTREEHFLVLVADAYSVVLTVVTGNPALLENSKGNRGLESLTLYGKSTQVRTTGAQLFDASLLKNTPSASVKCNGSDIIITALADGEYRQASGVSIGFFEKGDQICIAAKAFPKDNAVVLRDSNGVNNINVIISNKLQSVTIPDNGTYLAILCINKSVPVKAGTVGVFSELIINKGNVPKDYEPYTGGKPSPSPSYPQEIESVGDAGEIGVEVGGVNLLDLSKCKTINAYNLYCIIDGDVVSITGKSSSTRKMLSFRFLDTGQDLSGKKTHITIIKQSGVQTLATRIDYANNTIAIDITLNEIGGTVDLKFKVMVTLKNVGVVPYEPYKPVQKLIVPTPNGLPGIPVSSGGNYTDEKGQQWVCDEVDFKKGVYVQRIAKYISSGGENLIAPSTRDGVDQYIIAVKSEIDKNFLSFGFSNKFKCKNMFEANTFTVTDMFIYFRFAENTQTPETIREVLNGCEFWYVLATPIETPLSSADLAAYSALRTYSPTTTVINDAGAGMSVGYAKMK